MEARLPVHPVNPAFVVRSVTHLKLVSVGLLPNQANASIHRPSGPNTIQYTFGYVPPSTGNLYVHQRPRFVQVIETVEQRRASGMSITPVLSGVLATTIPSGYFSPLVLVVAQPQRHLTCFIESNIPRNRLRLLGQLLLGGGRAPRSLTPLQALFQLPIHRPRGMTTVVTLSAAAFGVPLSWTSVSPGNNTVYGKMVIVVHGRTGKVVFSYPADPSSSPHLSSTASVQSEQVVRDFFAAYNRHDIAGAMSFFGGQLHDFYADCNYATGWTRLIPGRSTISDHRSHLNSLKRWMKARFAEHDHFDITTVYSNPRSPSAVGMYATRTSDTLERLHLAPLKIGNDKMVVVNAHLYRVALSGRGHCP